MLGLSQGQAGDPAVPCPGNVSIVTYKCTLLSSAAHSSILYKVLGTGMGPQDRVHRG